MLTLQWTIRDHTQETTCRWCGFPLYIDDVAYTGPRGTYCSRNCSHQHDQQIKQAGKEKEHAIRV